MIMYIKRLVEKKALFPKFGHADVQNQIAYVRADLPESVKKFVFAHEIYHLSDKAKWWVWREIKANIAGAIKHPIGFIYCVIKSLAWYRLKFYYRRFKDGN